MMFSDVITYALSFSVFAFMMDFIFQPGELLDWWPPLADKFINIFPDSWHDKMKKPIYECAICMSGQVALCTSLIYLHEGVFTIPIVAWTIFFSYLISKLKTALDIWI